MTADRSADSALDFCPVALCRVRLADSAVLAANEEFHQLTASAGTIAELFGTHWFEQFTAADKGGTRQALLATREGRRLHARLKTFVGENARGEATLALIPALIETRAAELQQLIELLSDFLWEWDLRDDSARYFGHGVHAAGYVLEDVPARGARWDEYIHPEDQDMVHRSIAEYLQGKTARYRVEYRVRQADGHYRWVLGRGLIVEWDDDGRPRRMLGLITDITHRREREAERERLESQLRHVQKLDALGQLTGGIAHDFNNILAGILGYAELGLLEFADPRLSSYLEEIVRASERGRELIGKLLLFSRTGHDSPRRATSGSLDMVDETLRMLRPMLPSTLSITVDRAPDLPNALIDPSQLQQLILNLAINARDAIGQNGDIRVVLGLGSGLSDELRTCASCGEVLVRSDEWIELAIEDDGPGIAEEMRGRIFDPFFSTKDASQGSGLGLSVVHGIVHDHGGHILLESEVGTGTRFTVLLRQAAPEAPSLPPPSPELVVLDGRGRRILVVDDEPAICAMMSRLLERHGFEVEAHQDSNAALTRFVDSPDDWALVITDQSMPGLSGVELADELLAITPDLPILICSGFSDFVSPDNAKDLGFSDYLQKPVTASELFAAVHRCLPTIAEV